MIFALLFNCLFQQTDTSTICSSKCVLHLQNSTSLKITEKPLFNSGIEGSLVKQACVKTIEDTISKQVIYLKQDLGLLGNSPDKTTMIGTEQVGTNKIVLYNMKRKRSGKFYAIVKPDNCTCEWELEFEKSALPFVQNAFKAISFIE